MGLGCESQKNSTKNTFYLVMQRFIHKIKPIINWTLKITGLYLPFHKLVITLFSKREQLSKKYIKGKGLEIGALHTPLKTFNNAKVVYVDHLDTKGLRQHYPELKQFKFMSVGVVDNGETLKKVKSSSQDFVIANHFVEHCENPIAMLKNQLRVLKKGGMLYWAIPDMRFTFDCIRPRTSTKHMIDDFEKGPSTSRLDHYEEWIRLIGSERGEHTKKTAKQLMKDHYSIHFHTFTKESFKFFLSTIKRKYKFPFEILENISNINEFVCILKKL